MTFRRSDRLSRRLPRLECDLCTAETLVVLQPLPAEDALPNADQGSGAFQKFVETLVRRLKRGQRVLREILDDIVDPGTRSIQSLSEV